MLRSSIVCAVALAALIAPCSAHADQSFNCSASAFRVTVASTTGVEPVTANVGNTACQAGSMGGTLPATPLPLSGGGVFATTTFTGGAPLSQVAGASAGVGDLTLTSLLPGIPAPALAGIPGGGVISLPGIGTVDIRPALNALLTPAGPLLHVTALKADATAHCAGGNPDASATSDVGTLSIFGTTFGTTAPAEKTIQAFAAQTIDPSNVDISKVLAPTVDLSALQAALRPVLDALPNIDVPATNASVKVVPGEEVRSGDKLTRRALHVSVSASGLTLADAVVGEVTVDGTGVNCGQLAAAALGLGPRNSCTKRRITLIDVLQEGGKVKLEGAADPRRFAGRRVAIVSRWDGKVVTRPTVSRSGLFEATVPLPPASVRHGNRARYRAAIGSEKSLDLKLERRMLVTSVKALGNRRVRLRGHLTGPLGSTMHEISVTRRVSCGNVKVVKRFKPDSRGRFDVTLKGPAANHVYVFRFRSKVPYKAGKMRLFRTYTLPRYVLGT